MRDIGFDNSNFDFYDYKYPHNHIVKRKCIGRYVILCPIEGSAIVTIKNKVFEISNKQFMFIPTDSKEVTYHYIGNPIHKSFSFGFRYFPNVNQYDYPPQVVEKSEYINKLIFDLPKTNTISCNTTWKFYRFLYEVQKNLKRFEEEKFIKIRKALIYMRTNDIYDVPTLAKLCGMSETRFYVAFKELTGRTPIQTKQKLQAFKAEALLRSTDHSIEDIAKNVGFDSVRHFRKIFKKFYSVSPSEIRKK